MIGANARRDNEFKLLRFFETLPRHIGRPEGLRNNDLGVRKFFLEYRVLAVLARGNDESVTGLLEKLTKSELSRDAAQELTGLKVNRARGGRGRAVGITLDFRNVVASICLRITVNGIVIKDSNHLRHDVTPSFSDRGEDRCPPRLPKSSRLNRLTKPIHQDLGCLSFSPSAAASRISSMVAKGCKSLVGALEGIPHPLLIVPGCDGLPSLLNVLAHRSSPFSFRLYA